MLLAHYDLPRTQHARALGAGNCRSQDFDDCKARLIETGNAFREKATRSLDRIARLGDTFIRDNVVVMTHSFSRVVLALLLRAHERKVRFRVLGTLFVLNLFVPLFGMWARVSLCPWLCVGSGENLLFDQNPLTFMLPISVVSHGESTGRDWPRVLPHPQGGRRALQVDPRHRGCLPHGQVRRL